MRISWTVRDDVWHEILNAQTGEQERIHAYGKPYTVEMNNSDARMFQYAGVGAGLILALILVAIGSFL